MRRRARSIRNRAAAFSISSSASIANCGVSILYVSHDIASVERLCHTVAALDGGRLVRWRDGRAWFNRTSCGYRSSSSPARRCWRNRRLPRYEARRAAGPIAIDGKLDEKAWEAAARRRADFSVGFADRRQAEDHRAAAVG